MAFVNVGVYTLTDDNSHGVNGSATNSQDLLDAAEDKWGSEDPQFMILQEKPKPQRWVSPSGQPEPSVPKSAEEQNELIGWLLDQIEMWQGLLKEVADDKALEQEVANQWEPGSYGHRVVKQCSNERIKS